MSHELLADDFMISMNGERPWHHHLGTPTDVIEGYIDLADVLQRARLDWTVEKRPIFVRAEKADGGFDLVEVDGQFATVRTDTDKPLGVVGSGYTVFQNEQGLDMVQAMLDGSEHPIRIETAGSLRGNRTVWVLARLEEDVVIDGDRVLPFLLFSNTHDGTGASRLQPTPTRVVCQNTLSYAIRGARSAYTFRHTAGMQGRVEEARQAIGLAHAYYGAFEAEVEALMNAEVTPGQFDKVLDSVIPQADPDASKRTVNSVAKARGEVRSLYLSDPRVGRFTGTAWGVDQAFSTYEQWLRPVRGQGEKARAEAQARNATDGTVASKASTVRRALADAGVLPA